MAVLHTAIAVVVVVFYFCCCSLFSGGLLTLTRPVFNDTSFVGVLYTSIPFSYLIYSSRKLVERRRLSYVFVVGDGTSQLGLYHPLLPGDSLASVNVSVLEPEGVIEPYLSTR